MEREDILKIVEHEKPINQKRENKMISILSAMVEMVTTGQIMSRISCKDEEMTGEDKMRVAVLLPRAISGGIIHHENLGTAVLKKEIPSSRLTVEGDIVIKLSSPYDCALITKADTGLAVPSFCAVIRGIREELIDQHYLLGYLNSDYARKDLLMGVNASSMAMVRSRALKELKIPVPSLSEQKIIGKAYWQSCRRKMLLERLVHKQQEISDTVISEAILWMKKNG